MLNRFPLFAPIFFLSPLVLAATSGPISSMSSKQCIDVKGGSTVDGALIDQWTCNGQTNQSWYFSAIGSQYELVSLRSGKCVNVQSTSLLDQLTCNGGASQLWTLTSLGNGVYEIVSASGGCLTLPGSSQSGGTQLDVETCAGGANQQWSVNVAPAQQAPTTAPTTSWIGNSFSGASAWVQDTIDASFAASDGTVFTNSLWDEGAHEAAFYKNGAVTGVAQDLHGWSRNGGYAVTADSNYLYIGMSQGSSSCGLTGTNSYGLADCPPSGTTWYGVRRYNLSGVPQGFSTGYIHDASMAVVNTSAQIAGLATGGGQLFVSDSANNQIKIYNTSDMSAAGSFSVASPGAIAYDTTGFLWIAQTGTGQVLKYSVAGVLQSTSITVGQATALAVDSSGRLLVADNGSDQNVKIYTSIDGSPTLSGTLGSTGGQYAAPTGDISAARLGGITGVGVDSSGDTYVTMNGLAPKADPSMVINTNIRAFSSNGALLWKLFNNEFVSTGVIDPATDGADVYSKNIHYRLDYSLSPGQQAIDYSVTQDPLLYPNDPRVRLGTGFAYPMAIRYINGNKFLFMSTMYQNGLLIYRFSGETAIPSGWLSGGTVDSGAFPASQPSGNWIWRDMNGDGDFQANEFSAGDPAIYHSFAWAVDTNGNIWVAATSSAKTIRKYTVQGLDSVGNPIYTEAASTTYPFPGSYTGMARLVYMPTTDTMYLSGFINGTSDGGCWGTVGNTLSRYDGFTSGAPTQTWQISLPFTCGTSDYVAKAMDVAGNAIFVQDRSEGSQSGMMRVYDTGTGNLTTSFYPGSIVGGQTGVGWTDIPYAVHAYERQNGQYVVYTEDDLHGKILLYTW